MARELVVLWASRHRRPAWEALCADYRRRIERWLPIRDQRIRGGVGGASRPREEGEALRSALPEPCWPVALDRAGRMFGSEAFAQHLRRRVEEQPHPVVFVVGSDAGLDRAFLADVRETLSLGPMTLPHELARLVLYEQVYRAVSIWRGIKYHRS